MITDCDTTRMTIDFPKKEYKKLKALAALMGVSLRKLVLDFINASLEKTPNADTLAAIQDADEGINLTTHSNISKMHKKLGETITLVRTGTHSDLF